MQSFVAPKARLQSYRYIFICFFATEPVVEYLGRYTHRVAISNNRILSVEDGKVLFKWRDYKDNSQWKVMTLTAEEFIRRFLMHVLPKGFMKIRHYGILGNRNKTERLNLCKLLTGTQILEKALLSPIDLLKQIAGHDIGICPACGQSRIEFYMNLPPPLCIYLQIGDVAFMGRGKLC